MQTFNSLAAFKDTLRTVTGERFFAARQDKHGYISHILTATRFPTPQALFDSAEWKRTNGVEVAGEKPVVIVTLTGIARGKRKEDRHSAYVYAENFPEYQPPVSA